MSLELTRKRAKEIKKLRKQADKLWAEQRAVSHHAAEIAREARQQARAYGNESLLPAAERAMHRGADMSRDKLASGQLALALDGQSGTADTSSVFPPTPL